MLRRTRGEKRPRSLPRAVLAQTRPKNNVRNVLVFLGPVMTGMLTEPGVLWYCTKLLVPWVLASAGTYAINDLKDEVADRAAIALDPTDERANRPLMRDELTHDQVLVLGITWLLAAAISSAEFGPWGALIVCGYVLVNLVRSVVVNLDPPLIRRATIPDLSIVSAGFVARVLSVAPGVPSAAARWPTYLAVFFGAMVVSAGKRLAKLGPALRRDGSADRLVKILIASCIVTCVTFPFAGYMVRPELWPAVLIFLSGVAYSAAVWKYAEHPRRNPMDIFEKAERASGKPAQREWWVIVPAVAAALLFAAAIYVL